MGWFVGLLKPRSVTGPDLSDPKIGLRCAPPFGRVASLTSASVTYWAYPGSPASLSARSFVSEDFLEWVLAQLPEFGGVALPGSRHPLLV